MINLLLGVLLFGYAGWTLYKFIKKSKEGKCAGCSVKNRCNESNCSTDC